MSARTYRVRSCPRCGSQDDTPIGHLCPDDEGVKHLSYEGEFVTAYDERDVEPLVDALERTTAQLEEVRGHYGIEECSEPDRAPTDWDGVQEEVELVAQDARRALSTFKGEQS